MDGALEIEIALHGFVFLAACGAATLASSLLTASLANRALSPTGRPSTLRSPAIIPHTSARSAALNVSHRS